MPAIEVRRLSYAYRRVEALQDLDLTVPEGALYALLGPNGAGKTTLLQILAGLRRPHKGSLSLLDKDGSDLTQVDRGRMSYVAADQRMPAWMRLEQLEAYLAPLYPRWDRALAGELRDRFALDRHRKIGTLSRGERMKAALLCALAPRPELLLMDEPFTGMDPAVKDDLVRGLLASAANEGWTVLIASHDVGELELLADWVGFLQQGRMRLSEAMERLRARFRRVTVVGDAALLTARAQYVGWLDVEVAGRRLSYIVDDADRTDPVAFARTRFPGAAQVETREVSLREVFIAMTREGRRVSGEEAAA